MKQSLPRLRGSCAALASALALVGCGGGGDEAVVVTEREHTQAIFAPARGVPAEASVKGMWSAVYNWPLIAVHRGAPARRTGADSKADGTQGGGFIYDVWDGSGARTRAT